MDDDVRSLSQASADQHTSRVAEYEEMHNISRPLSPINLIVSSRATQPPIMVEKPVELSLSSQLQPADENLNHQSIATSSLTIRGTKQQNHSNLRSPQRRGKPPTCNALVGVPETIKLKDRNNNHLDDRELLRVSSLQSPSPSPSPLYPPTGSDRHSLLVTATSPRLLSQSLTTPALGYVEPKGELQRTMSHLFYDRRKMHRYNAGVSPIERIARIETDLTQVINTRHKKQQRQQQLSQQRSSAASYLKILPPTPTAQRPTPLLSPTSASSLASVSSNHKTIEVLFANPLLLTSSSPLPSPLDTRHDRPDLCSPLKPQLLPMNSSVSVFSDVHSPGGSLAGSISSRMNALQGSKQQQHLTSFEDYSQQKVQQIITQEQHRQQQRPLPHLLDKNLHMTAPAKIGGGQGGGGESVASPSPFSQAMQTNAEHIGTTGGTRGGVVRVKRDPSSYLTRDHRPDSADYKIYRLADNERHTIPSTDVGDGCVSADEAEISFQYLKQKILSTKDKIYDCGPEYYQKLYAKEEEKGEGKEHHDGPDRDPEDDPVTGITKIHKIASREKESEQNILQTMPSR
jgi:hypothetical protein